MVALAVPVQTRRRRKGKQEMLIPIEALTGKERWTFLSNAPAQQWHLAIAVQPPSTSYPLARMDPMVAFPSRTSFPRK